MPNPSLFTQDLPQQYDPARHFVDAEPWATKWQFRFVPPNHLHSLDVAADHGLERLIYFQTLICDETDTLAAAD